MATTMITTVFLLASIFFCGNNAVDSLRFFIIGDLGGINVVPFYTYYERCTAEQMGKTADLYSPQFILELGDNFYTDGVETVHDLRFNATFESIYTAKSLQVPWYFVAGNHDHHGNVTAQIDYSNYSKRWNFPSLYYYKEFPVGDGKHTVGILFIDTVTLCGHSSDDVHEPLKGPDNKKVADQQWDFIQQTLKTSNASYLFAAGHYPVYSTSVHGSTECLVNQLQPMLDTYNTNGYLAGHDHNLQHLRVTSSKGRNLDYFVSGMANTVDPFSPNGDKVPKGSSLFSYGDLLSKGGFLYAEATASNITFIFFNGMGKQLYSTAAFPRKV